MATARETLGGSLKSKQERSAKIYKRLLKEYPDAKCALDHTNALELLVATILSAQCTDARVNIVTKDLFKEFRTPEDYVANPARLEEMVHPCGFYRSKAKNIVKACKGIIEKHGGQVPATLEELTALSGVGRKTANVILGNVFDVPGITVDTHCGRLARRLAFTKETDPVKVERDLMKLWPEETWTMYSHLLIFHGRQICHSRAPKCSQCVVRDLCPFPDTREGRKIAK